jgi:hypothetical protein
MLLPSFASRGKQSMSNHLKLRYTLLEFDLQGNLTIFSNGRWAYLQTKEVPQLITWLSTGQQSGGQPQQIAHYHFIKKSGQVLIDSLITIPAEEVLQISSWLRQWYQKNQSRNRQDDASQ